MNKALSLETLRKKHFFIYKNTHTHTNKNYFGYKTEKKAGTSEKMKRAQGVK